MKYCMKCGAELPDEARFCAECGAQQERRPARRTEPPAERHEEPQAIHREEPQDIRHEEPQAVHREGPQAAPGRSHARQAVEEAVASWKTEVQPQLAKAGRSLPALSLSLPQKLGAFGAVVVVFAAFQPIVTLMNMMVLTIDDLSKSSQAFLALLGATSLPGWVLPVGVLVVFFVLFSTSSPSAALMNHLK